MAASVCPFFDIKHESIEYWRVHAIYSLNMKAVLVVFRITVQTQSVFTYSKLTVETLEQGVKYVH